MKKFFLIITILIFTTSCQSVKDGLTMQKNNSDEFLIKKKNPLVLPPDYGKLPEPGNSEFKGKKRNKWNRVLLKSGVENNSTNSKKKSQVEEIILKEIKTEWLFLKILFLKNLILKLKLIKYQSI